MEILLRYRFRNTRKFDISAKVIRCPSYAILHFAMKTEISASGLERAAEFIARTRREIYSLISLLNFF